MLGVLADSLGRYVRLLGAAFAPPPGRSRPTARRIAVMLLFIPPFTLLQVIHWLGLLLDEILFPGYRRVDVTAPLFILGVPRSGTTALHRLLARDPQFTSFQTWECLFAPSITERKALVRLARADRFIGRPFGRLADWLTRRGAAGMADVHAVDLAAAEEDYFVLMPAMACFLLAVPFPRAAFLWDIAQLDRTGDAAGKRLLRFYRSCLKRHLYVHGADKRLLSKNASFAGMAGALAAEFPDARFVVCLRDAAEAVPSQLSAIQPGVRAFVSDPDNALVTPRFVDLLEFDYRNLLDQFPPAGSARHVHVPHRAQKSDSAGVVRDIYARFGLKLSADLEAQLLDEADRARRYTSGHSYALSSFGLNKAMIRERFPPIPAAADVGG